MKRWPSRWIVGVRRKLLARPPRADAESAPADRDALEAAVAQRTAQLTGLVQHLQTAHEEDRRRLARELHDQLGALLTAAKLDAARVRSRLQQSPELLERMQHLDAALNQGIVLKRRIIEDLHPSSLANLGLVAALEILVGEFGEQSDLHVVLDLTPVELAPAAQLTVYRLVQEALANVVRHAGASQVRVTLGSQGALACVRIVDDGMGFAGGLDRASQADTHGLLAMYYRVIGDGGQFQVQSSPGAGTTISALIPQRRPAATPV